jgi:TonB-dependent receptor
MKNKTFQKTKLATSLSLALGVSAFAPGAMAAEAAAEEVEVIEVTGIRGSLIRSMDVKRENSGIVDAISAEDMGKFPDTNLAESLQRITGVSIDRRNGEGFQVTVRGFGPEFNQVTLNDRAMPNAQLNETGGLNTSRAFDMSNIASEGVAGVTVFKSARADKVSGGIGATVDLQTVKPFQTAGGFVGSIGAKAVHDTTNETGSDVTPELSGLVSWSNDMFGISVSASHQERDSGRSGALTNNGWGVATGAWTGTDFLSKATSKLPTDDLVIVNEPDIGQQTNIPVGVNYNHLDAQRTRDNAQVTLQLRPIDSLVATLDYTYAKQETELNRNEMSFWFGGNTFPVSAVEFEDENGVATPIYYLAENTPDYTSRDVAFGQQGGHIENTLDSIGLNLEWEINDSFVMTADFHSSEAKALPGGNGPGGNWWSTGLGAQGVNVQGFDNSGDLPLLVGVWDDRTNGGGNVPGAIDAGDISSTVTQINYDRIVNEIEQAKVDFEWALNDEIGIDFGLESRSMEFTSKSSFRQETMKGGWGASNPGEFETAPGSGEYYIEPINFADFFDGYRTGMSSEAQAFFESAYGGEGGALTNISHGFAGDAAQLGAISFANQGLTFEPSDVDNVNRTISEDITSAYAQIDFSGEAGDVYYNILAGVRYEYTEVNSSARVAATRVEWQGDNDFLPVGGSAADAPLVTADASYDHLLPSISITIEPVEDVNVRAAWSKTIARTNYANLQQGISGVGGPVGGPTILGGTNGGATNGNVGIKPVESNNFDLSVEWYYADASYASIGFFDKRVPNFIGNQVVETIADNTRDVTNGPRAQAAIDALNSQGIAVDPSNLFQMVASMDDGQGGCINTNDANLCGQDYNAAEYEGLNGWENSVDLVALDEDPLSVLDANTVVNANDAQIYGWEFAVQHFFGESGFGVQANATLVSGDVAYDVTETGNAPQFAVTGLSDTANFAFIYDNDDLQARITYNWRDKFLNATNVGQNEPQYTEEYAQIDFSVGYNITEDWSVSFEGLNITDEDIRQVGRASAQIRDLQIYGARYALSTRYTF